MFFLRSPFFARLNAGAVWIIAVLCASAAVCAQLHQVGEVRVDGLNLRSGPNLEAPVLRVLGKGSRVRILDADKENPGWLRVVHEDRVGYVYNDSRYLKRYMEHRVAGDLDADLAQAMARAKRIEREIQRKQEEIQAVSEEREAVVEDLEAIDWKISRNRRQLSELIRAEEKAAARIRELAAEAGRLRAEIGERKKYARRRLVALYKLYRLGEMNLLATVDSVQAFFSRKTAIERVVSRDQVVISEMAGKKRRLEKVAARMEEAQQQRRELAGQYEDALFRLAKMRSRRESVLAALKSSQSNREATLEYLRKSARRLDDMIASMKSGSGRDGIGFATYQGLLKMPVQGKIVSTFGKHTRAGTGVVTYNSGIEIRAERGAPIRAVRGGRAVYVDWLKGYGRVVILSHGDSYHTVYAHLEDLFCSRGQRVETGEVIATVGDTFSVHGPALYFEIRHQGNPVNPLEWIDPG